MPQCCSNTCNTRACASVCICFTYSPALLDQQIQTLYRALKWPIDLSEVVLFLNCQSNKRQLTQSHLINFKKSSFGQKVRRQMRRFVYPPDKILIRVSEQLFDRQSNKNKINSGEIETSRFGPSWFSKSLSRIPSTSLLIFSLCPPSSTSLFAEKNF